MGVHAVTVVVATLVVVMGTKAALAQLTCSFNSPVAVKINFNVNYLTGNWAFYVEGTWYTRYSSQQPSDVSNVKLIITMMKDVNIGGQRYIETHRQVVDVNNKCTDSSVEYYDVHADKGYIAIEGLVAGADTWDDYIYVMGVDSNVLLTYSNVKKNGADVSNIVIVMAKNPWSVTLTTTMKSNANTLCGGTAASSLSSYTSVNADTSAVCT